MADAISRNRKTRLTRVEFTSSLSLPATAAAHNDADATLSRPRAREVSWPSALNFARDEALYTDVFTTKTNFLLSQAERDIDPWSEF